MDGESELYSTEDDGEEYLDETEIQRIQQSVEEESTQILSIQNHINHIESLLCIESQSEWESSWDSFLFKRNGNKTKGNWTTEREPSISKE